MVINLTFVILILVLILVIYLLYLLSKIKNKNCLQKHFLYFTILLTLPLVSLSLQILLSKTSIPAIYFDYITYIFTFFAPVELLQISILFNKPEKNTKKVNFLYVIALAWLLVLWTNDYHHLFYEVYSVKYSETIFGTLFNIISAYNYILLALAMIVMTYKNLKLSGFFSIQTLMIIVGILIPLSVNLSGVFGIVSTSIYATPIAFVALTICFYIAIFKLKAFNIIPVASRTVMDTMSDAYVVISNDGTIADSNKTFKTKFKDVFEKSSDGNLFEIFSNSDLIDLSELKKHIEETRVKGKPIIQEYHFQNNKIDNYFEIDIHPISARNNKRDYIATLLVFKDITQHKMDIKQIEEKQDIIVKQQQLVSIGELAGGVAHDINTPISAIKTGIVMLNTMSGDRTDSEKEILERMDNCATKIINIVNSMRNQIRNLGGTTKVKFKVSNVLNDIKTITFHEVKKNNSEVIIDIKDDVEIVGDPTKLGQVLTNLIVNAAQAYGQKGGKINVFVSSMEEKYALMNVIDYAGGIDETIVDHVFKNILTTKGTSGTGLGLYLAYSVIKGEFNGEIEFNTQKGEGTTFSIKIPLAQTE